MRRELPAMTLTLPGVDGLPPERLRRSALSQWYTPEPVAWRMVRWALPLRTGARVLEPSSGGGALVDIVREVYSAAQIDAVDLDPENCEATGAECADYLARPAPDALYDLAIMNPPYEGGVDGRFLGKTMDEAKSVVALLRLAALCGSARHANVWRRVEEHDDDWHMRRLAIFASRPVFEGPSTASGSAKSDFVCVHLVRYATPTAVEWWT